MTTVDASERGHFAALAALAGTMVIFGSLALDATLPFYEMWHDFGYEPRGLHKLVLFPWFHLMVGVPPVMCFVASAAASTSHRRRQLFRAGLTLLGVALATVFWGLFATVIETPLMAT